MSREPFATYAEMDAAFVAYLKYADKWTAPKPEPVPVNPGDFATRRQESERWADFAHQPIACCCMPRRVDLTDDRSDFTRESFGSFL